MLQQNADRVLAKSFDALRVKHVFAEQKDRMGLLIRTSGIARATTKIGMANLVYNIKRFALLSHDGLQLPKMRKSCSNLRRRTSDRAAS